METQLLLSIRFAYLEEKNASPLLNLREQISKMLFALRAKLATDHWPRRCRE